jgi:lincosamide nucleotidyltransferase A/C/D/E
VTSRGDTSVPMDARSAVKILTCVGSWGVAPWVSGGWGIDALLGTQTRQHADLDLVVARPDCGVIQAALEPLGFVHDTWVEPGLPARIVLCTDSGHQVDLHPVIVDELGNGWQPLGAGAWTEYPAEGLGALGSIDGRQVHCLTPELQLRHHLGYPVDDKDLHDLLILATEFRLAVPPGLLDRDGHGQPTGAGVGPRRVPAQRAEVV